MRRSCAPARFGYRGTESETQNQKSRISLVAIAAGICAVWLAGCAAKNPPAPPPPKRIVQSPDSRRKVLHLIARAIPPVGSVLAVQIAVTSPIRAIKASLDAQGKVKVVEYRSLSLDAQGIRADTVSGASVSTLLPDQAIEAAGGAQPLVQALSRVYLVHLAGHDKEPGRAEWAAEAFIMPLGALGLIWGTIGFLRRVR